MGRNNQQRRAARARERAKVRNGQRAGAGFGAGWPGPGFGTAGGFEGGFGKGFGNGFGSFEAPPRGLRERVNADIEAALHSAHRGDAVNTGPAYHRLLDSAASESGWRSVSGTLADRLAQEVAWAWQHGWQPADLLRLTGRQQQPAVVAVVGDVIARDLDRYAEATIASRWPGQLREHGVCVWWGPDTNHLSARAACTAGGFAVVLAAALEGLALLAQLPALEKLDPVPGSAHPRRELPAIDDRILSRVRAFLAKAEATTYEAEADTFTAAAQQLMARHSIDAAMLAAAAPTTDGTCAVRVGIDRPYEAPKATLLSAVADANRCRTVWSQSLGFVTVVGFEGDLIAVETLFTSLLVQATTAMAGYGRQVGASGTSHTRSFRSSFLTAFAVRIGQRLAEVTAAETAAAQERARQEAGLPDSLVSRRPDGPSRDVVVVLDRRRAEVDEAVSALFPELVQRRTNAPTNAAGWTAGVRAADQANLFGGSQVERHQA